MVEKRIAQLEAHFEKTELRSFDPYDGLNTPLRKLFFKIRILERLWLQFIRLIPVNIRRIVGIKKMIHLKTVSDLLSASSILYEKTNDQEYLLKAEKYFMILGNMDLKQSNGSGWGLRFYFSTRFVQANDSSANLFNTINVLNSLLDYYTINKKLDNEEPCIKIKKLIDVTINFIEKELGYTETESTLIWNYWEGLKTPVYNVNALMVGFLSRYKKMFNDNKYDGHIQKTLEFLKQGQNAEGSWNYSAGSEANFIDGFHTGYILEGLSIAKLNGVLFDEAFFEKGVKYFLEYFFTKDYLPKYYNKSLYPIDGQNFAQAIQTLYYLYKVNDTKDKIIDNVLEQTDKILWNEKGYYNYMKTKYFTYTTAMDRWVNAPMYLALSYLY
ncbi:MAG: hypothetical protein J0M18_08140 [Ignavibacteria bacterium]|nr:hypothetical protein [Ignavibacteria bacterium]